MLVEFIRDLRPTAFAPDHRTRGCAYFLNQLVHQLDISFLSQVRPSISTSKSLSKDCFLV